MLLERGKHIHPATEDVNEIYRLIIAGKKGEQGVAFLLSILTQMLIQLRRRRTARSGLAGGILIPCRDLFHCTAGA